MSGWFLFGPAPPRVRFGYGVSSAATTNSSTSISAGCVGSADQIHSLGGLCLPCPLLVARRFHTMWPVYFGFLRMSRTAFLVQYPRAREGSGGSGSGYRTRSLFRCEAICSCVIRSIARHLKICSTTGPRTGSGASRLLDFPSARFAGTGCGILTAMKPYGGLPTLKP